MSARQIMSADEMRRALVRIGHEIVERQGGTEGLALVGILRRGDVLAARIADAIREHHGADVPTGALDVTAYRDDRPGALDADAAAIIRERGRLPFAPDHMTIVLVDDVLFTGRTVRAALDALRDLGRPAAVRLAVLVDRGHREVPIRADHVGRNVPTSHDERVVAQLSGVDEGEEQVLIVRPPEPA